MKLLNFILLYLFITSCSPNKQENVKSNSSAFEKIKVTDVILTKTDSGKEPIVDTTSKLFVRANKYFFSSMLHKDIFEIAFYGKKIPDGYVVFKISDHKNKKLYEQIFEPSTLFDHSGHLNSKQQAEVIKAYVSDFLSNGYFQIPAIKSSRKIDNAFLNNLPSDKDWADVKSDPKSIGFYYPCGQRTICGIAFNKKKHNVVWVFLGDSHHK